MFGGEPSMFASSSGRRARLERGHLLRGANDICLFRLQGALLECLPQESPPSGFENLNLAAAQRATSRRPPRNGNGEHVPPATPMVPIVPLVIDVATAARLFALTLPAGRALLGRGHHFRDLCESVYEPPAESGLESAGSLSHGYRSETTIKSLGPLGAIRFDGRQDAAVNATIEPADGVEESIQHSCS
jgi:hypothetical protein